MRAGHSLRCFALLACLLFLTARLAAGEGAWVGKKVMPRSAGIRLWYGDDLGRQVSVGPFEDAVVPVLAERGEWIKIRHQGLNAWFAKQDAVFLDDAVAHFTARLRQHPQDSYAHVMRAEAWHELGNMPAALDGYTEAIRLRPDRADLYINRGLLHLERKDHDRAFADFDAAVRLNPRDARALVNRAFVSAARGDYGRAIEDYDAALRLTPRDAAIYNYRGAAYYQRGEIDAAVDDYRRAIRLDPDLVSAWNNRGLALLGKKAYDRAAQDFAAAIRLDPACVASYLHLAWILAACPDGELRDGRRAVQYATKACELTHGKDALALDSLAAACAECGQFAEAVKWQQKALELGHADKQIDAEARQRLQLYTERQPCRLAGP